MSKNPLIIIPIIGLLIALFNFGKVILPDGQISKGQAALQKMQADNNLSRIKMKVELDELKKIENPSKHNIWHIAHLEKMIAHINRYDEPRFKATTPLAQYWLIPMSIVVTILTVALIYMWHYFKNRSKFAPRPGLNNGPARIYPQNDPVAAITHWQSMASGASNFKMQQLEITSSGIKISASFEVRLFCWGFLGGGLAPIIIEYLLSWGNIDSIIDPWLGAPGVFVLLGGILYWVSTRKKIEFNKVSRVITASNQVISFNDVYALQVISSLSGGHGHGIFRNHELNLVLNDGQRINLLNHGGEAAFEYQEAKLSEMLGVPVWQA